MRYTYPACIFWSFCGFWDAILSSWLRMEYYISWLGGLVVMITFLEAVVNRSREAFQVQHRHMLIVRDLADARLIQRNLIINKFPEFRNIMISGMFRPMEQVGGDFYDVIELPNNRLGIFIADVADKGMPAALFMALTRTLMRAAILETSSPAEALRRVNDSLLPDTQQGMFITAVYGELDLDQGTFTYVNAGHNPPFWVKTDGSFEKLTRTSIALGVMEQPSIEQRVISFKPGETLLLYTDGLTEAFSPSGDLFGEVRLLDVMASLTAGTAEEVIVSIEECLNDFVDTEPLADDLTMLAIRMAG